MKHCLRLLGILWSLIILFLPGIVVPVHVDKVDAQQVTVYNQTSLDKIIQVTIQVTHNTKQHEEVLPLTVPASGGLMLTGSAFVRSPARAKLVAIEDPSHQSQLALTRVKDRSWSITLTAPSELDRNQELFSFIPPIINFRSGLCVDEKRWQDIMAGRWNYTKATAPKSTKEFVEFITKLYEKNSIALQSPSPQAKIPKIIHHVWFGSKLPTRFETWYKTWIDKHPDWQHILWTDQECIHNETFIKNYPNYRELHIRELGLLQNQVLFDQAKNYGEKSDIIRYEILNQYGGLYIDIDFECFEPFDILHHCYDFYAGMLPLDTGLLTVNNGLIAARANHPILQRCMDIMKSSKSINRYHYFAIICATGPVPMTRAVWQAADQDDNVDIVFPCTYFYPLPYRKPRITKKIDVHPESMTVHYFTKTWARASAHQK